MSLKLSSFRTDLITVLIARRTESGWEHLQLRRTDGLSAYWSLCRGTLEDEETHLAGALRELREETQLTPPRVKLELYSLGTAEQFYSHLFEAVCLSPTFAAIVPANAEPVLNEEHSEYRWVADHEIETELLWPSELGLVQTLRRYVFDGHRAAPLLRIPELMVVELLG